MLPFLMSAEKAYVVPDVSDTKLLFNSTVIEVGSGSGIVL